MEASEVTQLREALAAGSARMRSFGRLLAANSDSEALAAAARWLDKNVSPSIGLPWAGAYYALGKLPSQAVNRYEEWLKDVESPPVWHLGQLCRAYQKLGDAAGTFRSAGLFHPWDLEYGPRAIANKALMKARRAGHDSEHRPFRLAVLSTFSTQAVEACLRVGAARLGLDLELYVAEMDQLQVESRDPSSALYAHEPEVVLIATTWRDLRPSEKSSSEAQADSWAALWETLLQRTSAHVLQHTFDWPVAPPLGHLEAREATSLRSTAHQVNRLLAERASARVSLVDYEQVVFRFGAARWCDPRQWHWAKEAVTPAASVELAEEYLAVLRPLVGKTKKVLVLDLDNTLWGGVVGEDGVEGLMIGPPSPEGEAHQELQRYARALREQGVLLAVCSKNNPDDARRPFQELADMVLTLDDFVHFQASWDAKPTVVARIAQELNLGLDSFVFVDDNPAERAQMRRQCPQVLTIPLSDDSPDFVGAIHRARAFEQLATAREDSSRTEQYRAERERHELRGTVQDLEAYYKSLEMVGVLRPFGPADLTRVVQLAGRSNQFNLTTWRLTPADVQHLAASEDHETRTLRLRDRFGDYGLVLVFVAQVEGAVLDIKALFMSCRVIGRTVEQLALAELEAIARSRGCLVIQGTFIPTKKNQRLVQDLYPRLGFDHVSGEAGQTTTWRRNVEPDSATLNPYIEIQRF